MLYSSKCLLFGSARRQCANCLKRFAVISALFGCSLAGHLPARVRVERKPAPFVQISDKGVIISRSHGKALAGVVGQQFTFVGEPGGGTWNFDASAFSQYTGLGGGPKPLDRASNPVSAYWATAGEKTIIYTVNGAAATATLSIRGATGGISTSYIGKVQIVNGYLAAPIQFSAKMSLPTYGKEIWVQVIDQTKAGFYDSSGLPLYECALEGSPRFPALDQQYPYPYSPGDVPAILPPSPPLPGVVEVQDRASFSMYLLWQASGVGTSYPVPVAVLHWTWEGTAHWTDKKWNVVQDQSRLAVSSSGPTATYPAWSSVAASGNFKCRASDDSRMETKR